MCIETFKPKKILYRLMLDAKKSETSPSYFAEFDRAKVKTRSVGSREETLLDTGQTFGIGTRVGW